MESQTGTCAQERLTRTEVAQAVRDAFGPGPAGRAAILACAERSNAREEVLAVLRRLPAREFADVRQLWAALPQMPVR